MRAAGPARAASPHQPSDTSPKPSKAPRAASAEGRSHRAWDWPAASFPLAPGLDLSNTNVIITGGTSGVGLEAAKALCARNARLFLVGDNADKGQRALGAVHEAVPTARVDFFQCDVASLQSVRTFVEAFKALGVPLHVLALNAGCFLWPYRKTPDGFELTMATNYLGHFWRTHLLLPELQAAAPSRIVWMASAFEQLGTLQWQDLGGEFARDSDLLQYCNSKLCCVMAAREMARRLAGSGVDVLAVQPGLVDTPLYSRTSLGKPSSLLYSAAARLFGQSAARGAASLIHAAAAPELDGKGGAYFGPPYLGLLAVNALNTSRLTPLNPQAHGGENCRRLYEETAGILERATGQPLPNRLPPVDREHPWQRPAATAPAKAPDHPE